MADSAASRSSALRVGSRMRARWSDHTANCARSSGGMPSISAMTITGSGLATASMRSKPDGSSTASSSVVMSSRMWGSRAATARGVKALLTRARSRVWSGGVEEQHARLLHVRQAGPPAGCDALSGVAGEVAVVAQNGVHVREAREHPGVHQPAAVHGVGARAASHRSGRGPAPSRPTGGCSSPRSASAPAAAGRPPPPTVSRPASPSSPPSPLRAAVSDARVARGGLRLVPPRTLAVAYRRVGPRGAAAMLLATRCRRASCSRPAAC